MDNPTIIIIVTISVGFLGLVLRYAFKSKCDQVNLCFGCLNIHREVERETSDLESKAEV